MLKIGSPRGIMFDMLRLLLQALSVSLVILVKPSLETLQEEVVKSVEPRKFIQHKLHIPTPSETLFAFRL